MNDKYFQPLHIPNLEIIQQKVYSCITADMLSKSLMTFTKRHATEIFEQINSITELTDFLKAMNWYEYHVDYAVNVMHPLNELDIHKDPMPSYYNTVRMLIPVYGCKNTLINFYKTKIDPITEHTISSTGDILPYLKYYEKDCELVTALELLEPVLINTQNPHGIKNNNINITRINLLVDFNSNIDFSPYFT